MSREQEPHESIAVWPRGTMGGDDVSIDKHENLQAAWAVCQKLVTEGFGGDGKAFPVAVVTRWIPR